MKATEAIPTLELPLVANVPDNPIRATNEHHIPKVEMSHSRRRPNRSQVTAPTMAQIRLNTARPVLIPFWSIEVVTPTVLSTGER
jgi:hypothetical protein